MIQRKDLTRQDAKAQFAVETFFFGVIFGLMFSCIFLPNMKHFRQFAVDDSMEAGRRRQNHPRQCPYTSFAWHFFGGEIGYPARSTTLTMKASSSVHKRRRCSTSPNVDFALNPLVLVTSCAPRATTNRTRFESVHIGCGIPGYTPLSRHFCDVVILTACLLFAHFIQSLLVPLRRTNNPTFSLPAGFNRRFTPAPKLRPGRIS